MAAFDPIGMSGALLVRLEIHRDSRGDFARTWSAEDFRAAGIDFAPVQSNASTTNEHGTIRGMHFQRAPREEAKLVRCARGRIWDVITDLRPDSPTFRQSFGLELAADADVALFVPTGVAHGFQTMTDDVRVEYLMSAPYAPELADGFRYDDTAAAIAWPLPARRVSDRDLAWPPLATRGLWTGTDRFATRRREKVG